MGEGTRIKDVRACGKKGSRTSEKVFKFLIVSERGVGVPGSRLWSTWERRWSTATIRAAASRTCGEVR